jgi:ankyrin repeat protein
MPYYFRSTGEQVFRFWIQKFRDILIRGQINQLSHWLFSGGGTEFLTLPLPQAHRHATKRYRNLRNLCSRAMPATWLREQGFDPEGDLTKAIPSEIYEDITSTAMFEAAFAGELRVCRYLWDQGAPIHAEENGQTPMWAACRNGHLHVAQWLFLVTGLVGRATYIRTKDNCDQTPMLVACGQGHLDVAQWLFKVGAAADIRTKDNGGETPMYNACWGGHLDVAQWLFKVGAAADIRTKDTDGYTPMMVACLEGNLHVAQWLFPLGEGEGAAADIRTKNNFGQTPMMIACLEGRLDVAQWLFKGGAEEDICTKDSNGQTPMFIACQEGHLNVAQWLLLEGAAKNNYGHVDRSIIREMPDKIRAALSPSLQNLITSQGTFVSLVLTATRFTVFNALTQSSRITPKKTCASSSCSPGACSLASLRGHEESLLMLIAEFAGVVKGRQLRNARQAARALKNLEELRMARAEALEQELRRAREFAQTLETNIDDAGDDTP